MMIYDKGYEDLAFAIIKQAIYDLIKALCKREYARHFLGNIDRSRSALSTYRKHDETVKEIKNFFFESDIVSLIGINGPYLFYLICGKCEDMNYDYHKIINAIKNANWSKT